ncbi:hypothetical protein NL489_30400 [Klebsiella pneumoniae]|nr:hypothetical protein [Klebsiella pneumoniae]
MPAAITLSLREWLIAWGPTWLILGAGLAALVGRRLLRRAVAWRPVAWLLD